MDWPPLPAPPSSPDSVWAYEADFPPLTGFVVAADRDSALAAARDVLVDVARTATEVVDIRLERLEAARTENARHD